MSWREQLQAGRFRDAPFFIDGAEHTLGRRTVLHEYPLRDLPWSEDLGRKAREFAVECYVLGPDYMAARDRLVAALEREGPGLLVHPYLGQMQVAVRGDVRVRESSSEGGLARFSIRFVEAGANRQPAGSTDSAAAVRTRADAARAAVEGEFGRRFVTAGLPQFVADSAAGLVTELMGTLRAPPGPLATAALPAYLRTVDGALGQIGAAVYAPASLATLLTGVLGQVSSLYDTPARGIGALRRQFTYGATLPNVPATTAVRQQQATNQAALVRLVRQGAVIEAARTSAGQTFETYDEAAALRDELAGEIDVHLLEADDPTYPVMQDLRAAVIRDITARGADLARVVEYSPRSTLPALVIAHRLYGDATRETDIVARNRGRVRHPGFVPGGAPLDVLTEVA